MRPLRARTATLVLALLSTMAIGAACDSGLAPDATADAPLLEIRVVGRVPTAAIDIAVRNASAAAWRFNPCAGPYLERRDGDAWVREPDPLILCAPTELTLGAGESTVVGLGVPAGAPAATYRVRMRFTRADGVTSVSTTGSFDVP